MQLQGISIYMVYVDWVPSTFPSEVVEDKLAAA